MLNTKKYSRIGFNTAEAGVTDKPYFVDLTKRLRSNWVLIIDSDPMCQQLIPTGANVIDRRTSLSVEDGFDDWGRKKYKTVPDEGNVWRTHAVWRDSSKYVKAFVANSPDPRTVKYFGPNEPNFANAEEARKFAEWIAECAELLMQYKDANGTPIEYKATICHFSPANERLDWAEQGVYDPILRVIAKYPNRLWYSGHAYTWGCLALGVGVTSWVDVTPNNLSAMRPERWARADQINARATWHLLRTNWVTNIRAQAIGLRPIPTVITEFGWGKMSDIDNGFYQTMEAHYHPSAGENGLDGGESLKHLYRAVYPEWTHAQAMAEQIKWAERLYPSNVDGILIFAYGTYRRFAQDYSDNRELHDRLVSAYGTNGSLPPIATPPVIKPLPPAPTIPAKPERWQSARLSPKSTLWVNMRDSAGMSGKVVRKVSRNTSALVRLDGSLPDVNDKTLSWIPVRIGADSGYIRSDVLTITWVK